MLELAGSVLFLVFGLAVGSFLNVLIYRLPREESVVYPPSHCPGCSHRLSPTELIPLVSFLALRGRCRHCGARISWRYFLVELLTGLVFLGGWLAVGVGPEQQIRWVLFPALIFAALMIAIFFIDLDHQIIPHELSVAAAGLGVVTDIIGILTGEHGMLEFRIPYSAWVLPIPGSLVGLVIGGVVFIAIGLFGYLLFRQEAMGGGDVVLGAAIGAMVGWKLALLSFALAIFSGAVIGILVLAWRAIRRQQVFMAHIPFGPFMVIWALAVLLAPRSITGWAGSAWAWWVSKIGG